MFSWGANKHTHSSVSVAGGRITSASACSQEMDRGQHAVPQRLGPEQVIAPDEKGFSPQCGLTDFDISCSPVTNLLSEDHGLRWVAPGAGRHWVVFNFGAPYTITAIEIIGRYERYCHFFIRHLTRALFPLPWHGGGSASKAMPKELQLEVGRSMEGPWRVIKTFQALPTCPNDQLDPITLTFSQRFHGFHAASQVPNPNQPSKNRHLQANKKKKKKKEKKERRQGKSKRACV
jgi:hypothetical protein